MKSNLDNEENYTYAQMKPTTK